jgi:competence transcription factor ComK
VFLSAVFIAFFAEARKAESKRLQGISHADIDPQTDIFLNPVAPELHHF